MVFSCEMAAALRTYRISARLLSYVLHCQTRKSAGRGLAERMTVTNRQKKDSDVPCREQASSRHAKRWAATTPRANQSLPPEELRHERRHADRLDGGSPNNP